MVQEGSGLGKDGREGLVRREGSIVRLVANSHLKLVWDTRVSLTHQHILSLLHSSLFLFGHLKLYFTSWLFR